MSEAIADVEHASALTGSQPAYGEGRLSYDPPPTDGERLVDRGHDLAMAFVIFAPVLVAYVTIGYGLYRALGAIS